MSLLLLTSNPSKPEKTFTEATLLPFLGSPYSLRPKIIWGCPILPPPPPPCINLVVGTFSIGGKTQEVCLLLVKIRRPEKGIHLVYGNLLLAIIF
jgi:hypothetical protein